MGADQIVADIARDADAAARACEGVEAVVHLAGDNEVAAARDPAFALGGTVLATERLVEAVLRTGVRRLVYMSTMHVYGRRMTGGAVLTEDLRPEPRSTYAIARLASEHLTAALASAGVEVVVLRMTNSVGAPAIRLSTAGLWRPTTYVARVRCMAGSSFGPPACSGVTSSHFAT